MVQYVNKTIPQIHRTANLLRFCGRTQQLVGIVLASAISKGNNSEDTLNDMYYASKYLNDNNFSLPPLVPM